MKIHRIDAGKIFRIALCCVVALCMLAPLEGEAAKKKRRKATTTATTKKKISSSQKKTSSRRYSSSSRASQRTAQRSVTQATQEAAISASHGRSSASAKSKSGGKTSSLAKITVDKPDLEEIRIVTLDPKSKYYYPKLWAKYSKNDTTMTPDEYRHLYLGYMFQEDYDPYRTSPYSDITDAMRDISGASKADIDTIRHYAEMALKDNPFDLRQMSFLVHLLKERKKDMSAKVWEYRLEHLLGAIKSTGTGEDEENAWYVIYPMHEYDMIQLMGYEAVDVEYVEPGIDHLLVQPDGSVKLRNPAKGFYFNFIVPNQQYELKHPELFEDDTESSEETFSSGREDEDYEAGVAESDDEDGTDENTENAVDEED